MARTTHRARIVCPEFTRTVQDVAAARAKLVEVERLGACHGPHHIEQLVDGRWLPVD